MFWYDCGMIIPLATPREYEGCREFEYKANLELGKYNISLSNSLILNQHDNLCILLNLYIGIYPLLRFLSHPLLLSPSAANGDSNDKTDVNIYAPICRSILILHGIVLEM
jgi:hypothetical protein